MFTYQLLPVVVIKNPSDFVGQYIGHSEANTKAILASTIGKVLVIDEVRALSYDVSNATSPVCILRHICFTAEGRVDQ